MASKRERERADQLVNCANKLMDFGTMIDQGTVTLMK